MALRLLLLLILLLPASAALGNPAATVEAVRPPAWVDDQGTWVPVPAGFELNAGHRMRTGPGGRVLLRLAEGSELRLGSEASFKLIQFGAPDSKEGRFTGLLDLARGALRFTTTLVSGRHRRDLNLRVATVNAGISGTDVWAKAASDRDIVCLIEGRITVSRVDGQPEVLNKPLSFYVAPKDSPPKPVRAVTPEQLETWIAQVDLLSGTGIISNGAWTVALSSFRTAKAADRDLKLAHAAGIPARVIPVTVDGETWRRLVVSGFESRTEATAFVARAQALMGVVGAWVY